MKVHPNRIVRVCPKAHQDKEEPRTGNPVVHLEVVGRDAQTLQSFYKDAFDWQMQEAIPDFYAMAHPGGEGGINGGIGAAMGDGVGHVTFYVTVPDLEAALSKIEDLGGSTVMGPTEVPEGPPIAMFADPEGHLIDLLKADS